MDNQNFLTKEGLEKLKREYKELLSKKRPVAVERLSLARSQGDLAENSEYAAAKDELLFIDDRITELERILKNAKAYTPVRALGKVDIGSKVTVVVNDEKLIYEIVSEFESDPTRHKISFKSPIGRALINRKVGEVVAVEVPAGKLTYKIISLE